MLLISIIFSFDGVVVLLGEKLMLVKVLSPEGKKEEKSRPTVAIPSYT